MLSRTTTAYLSAPALQAIAGGLVDDVLRTETAETLPVPVKIGAEMGVVILFYNKLLSGPPYQLYPPHHRLILNATTGEAIRFEAVTPHQLGLKTEPGEPLEDPGIDPNLDVDTFWDYLDRFLAISHLVWYAFNVRNTPLSGATESLVREYALLFPEITMRTEQEFYKAAAPDFFAWLARYAS